MNEISVIVPVFNEEEILERKALELKSFLMENFDRFQILISENGSRDNTKNIVKKLDNDYPEINGLIDNDKADYGEALIAGINHCMFEQCAILEIDYLDFDFLMNGYKILDNYDMIVGSKKISPGIDRRSWKRKFFTHFYNLLIRINFNLDITETHGLKVFNKSRIKPLSDACVSRAAVYPSELVIRSHIAKDVTATEIKLTLPLEEIRTTRIKPLSRFKSTVKDLLLLRRIIRK